MTESRNLPRGVFAAILTPLDATSAPDHPAFLGHAHALLDGGCDGLAVLGSTGEANSLPLDQRLALIETVGASLPADRLLIGTGACALADAVRLTRASLAAGVRNVLVLPPFYYKPVGDDGVFAYFAGLIDAIGDGRLRIFLYNFPQLTGFAFDADLVDRLRRRYGPVIAGMKDSSGDWESMKARCDTGADFAVYAGTERYLLDILNQGGAGCITATANLTAGLCQAVYRAWGSGKGGEGEEAARLQARLTELRLALQRHPPVPSQKALLHRLTGADVWTRMLPPFTPMATDAADALLAELRSLGLASEPRDATAAGVETATAE